MPATQAHWSLPHPQHSHQDPRSWHSLAHFAPGEQVGGEGGAGHGSKRRSRCTCATRSFDPWTTGGGTSGGTKLSIEVKTEDPMRPPYQPKA